MKWLLVLVFLFLGAGTGFLFYTTENYYKKPTGPGATTEVFEVEVGESFTSIARRLEERKLIKNAFLLNMIARFYGLRDKMRVGEYALKDSYSPKEILKILAGGKSITYPFTITEGLNSYEVAHLFENRGFGPKDTFIKLCNDAEFLQSILKTKVDHCEGYLFPETYNFARKTSARQMMTVILKTFLVQYEAIAQGRNLGGWSRHQIVTFASLIEKETGAVAERPLIASVFYNRLRKGMKLQTDPTVQYGVLRETGVYSINITKKHLLTPTPYNTYTKEGLPPGPISNPGGEALKAVFEPDESEFLFFVSRNDGTHVFSKTYEEHDRAVKSFQLNSKAREGKSWRDLKNPPVVPPKKPKPL